MSNLDTQQKIVFYTFLFISALMVFAPVIIGVFMSFMTTSDIMTGRIIPTSWSPVNFVRVFERLPLLHFFINSFIATTIITAGQLILSSLAAYAFVFLKFKGRDLLFYIFIATMMVPSEAYIIANFQTIRNWNMLNTYAGLTLPFFATAFGTFLLRQSFKQIPKELKEQGDVLGIGNFKFYLMVVLPMARPSLITLGIHGFLTSWNMYLWPLLVTTTNEVRTVQIGLRQLQAQEALTEWGVVTAGTILVVLPTLLLVFFGQSKLQKGIAKGALK